MRLTVRNIGVCTALLVAMSAALPAQNRERDFGLSSDAWCRQDREADHCEVREESFSRLATVDVDARPNGGIAVRGWDRDDVHVRVRILAHAESESAARALAAEVRLINESGRIRAEGPRSRGRQYWTAGFELQVPRQGRLALDSHNGGISVSGFSGSAMLQTHNGGLALSDVGGDIRGRTTNGGVTVTLNGDRWEGAGLDVETTNGGVRMTVPAGFSAELEARTSNGGINIDFPVRIQGSLTRNRLMTATLGSGGAPLRVTTTNGGVNIMRR